MSYRFKKHYTREEAQALLPTVREWLVELEQLRGTLQGEDQAVERLMDGGEDRGGMHVNQYVRTLASIKDVIARFQGREIQLKDLDRGLIDFPSVIGGREVFLCWEKDEETIEFWHDLDSGYSGREPL